jgi:dephospho-CoA kinase
VGKDIKGEGYHIKTLTKKLLLFIWRSLIMKSMKVVSIVGMTGAGKSEVSRVFEQNGFTRIRFGDLTDEEMKKRDLEPNEENERFVRELLRQENGPAAYARLNQPRIERALETSDVVIDGLYSWQEYTYLKSCYGESLYLVAVWSSPRTRYARLSSRSSRRLTVEEAISRDRAEIENTQKGGPIAMADFTIVNESSLENLKKEAERIIATLR